MLPRPPSTVIINSAALIAGTITTVILAAPGAGKAYRLLIWAAGIPRNPGAGAGVDFNLIETGAGTRIWQLNGFSAASSSYFHVGWPVPGILVTVNQGISAQAIATAAGGVATYNLAYYIDNIN